MTVGPLYTVKEVAEMLRLNPDTVRDFLQRGSLRGYKIGGQWRVSEDQLTAFVKARYQQ